MYGTALGDGNRLSANVRNAFVLRDVCNHWNALRTDLNLLQTVLRKIVLPSRKTNDMDRKMIFLPHGNRMTFHAAPRPYHNLPADCDNRNALCVAYHFHVNIDRDFRRGTYPSDNSGVPPLVFEPFPILSVAVCCLREWLRYFLHSASVSSVAANAMPSGYYRQPTT